MRLKSPPVGLGEVAETDLVRQVARSLTEAVMQGRLPPGAKVVEAAIARELGISRAPVREAARLLESQGLLRASPRRGFFVRELSARDVDEVFDLRICVERHAAIAAAQRLDDEARTRLREQVAFFEVVASRKDSAAIVEADFQFHRLVFETAGNSRLLRVFDSVASECRVVIGLFGRYYDDPLDLARAHGPLLAAIEGGKPKTIVAEVDHHLGVGRREVGAMVRALFSTQPEGA